MEENKDENYVYIGKIVNTHGIKGELRLLSDFPYKDRVFLESRRIYIGENHEEEVIASYRHHKIFEMITLKGYCNINQVLKYLNQNVYIKKNDLSLTPGEYLEEDLINLNVVLGEEEVGKVLAIRTVGSKNKVMEVEIRHQKTLIPYHKDFIKKIDLQHGQIELELIEGMTS